MASCSLNKESDEVYVQYCDVCLSQSTTSDAFSYCSICWEHLCQSCDKAHRGSRATKDHAILTGSQIHTRSLRTTPTPPIMYCDVHKPTILKLFCKAHGEALCNTCKMTKHPSCDTIELNHYIAQMNVAERCSQVEASLDDLTSKINNFKKSRPTERSTFKTQIQKCLHDMQELRKTVNDRLVELEQTLSSQLRDIEQTIDKEIESSMVTVDDIMQQIEYQKSVLNQYKNVQNEEVTFITLNKISPREKEYRNMLDVLQKQVYDRDVRFQPDDGIKELLLQLTSLGTILYKQPKYLSPVPKSVLDDFSIMGKQEIDVGSCSVLGCTFMSDGHLVLACGDDGLKLLDKDFHFIYQFPEYLVDVSAINDSDIIGTQSGLNQLKRIRVLPDMKVVRALKLDRRCGGVDVYRDEIYVTCHDNPGKGEVVVLNMDGQVLRRLGMDNGEYKFTRPLRVKVSPTGSALFISDMDKGTVTCLNQQGHEVYKYPVTYLNQQCHEVYKFPSKSKTNLRAPTGMFVDSDNNVLVCGLDTNNVHLFYKGLKRKEITLVQNESPISIAYRHSDRRMAVGLHMKSKSDKKLLVFRLSL